MISPLARLGSHDTDSLLDGPKDWSLRNIKRTLAQPHVQSSGTDKKDIQLPRLGRCS